MDIGGRPPKTGSIADPVSEPQPITLAEAGIDKDSKEARNKRIFAMWMACYTQEEIAEECDCSVQPIKDAIADYSANLPKNLRASADHATDCKRICKRIAIQVGMTIIKSIAYGDNSTDAPSANASSSKILCRLTPAQNPQ
jgi:hypothetical protein